MVPNNNYYLAPKPFPYDPDRYQHELSGWANEFLDQSRTYLRQQAAYQYIQEGIDLVNGEFGPTSIPTLSSIRTNTTVRSMRELVAAQSNLRIIPAISTYHPDFYEQKAILNKVHIGWQGMTFADRQVRKAWQYACACGTAYIGVRWDKDYWRKGEGEIVYDGLGPMDVLPIGLPNNFDLNRAYGVAVKVVTPIHELIRNYPTYIDKLKPKKGSRLGGPGTLLTRSIKYATSVLQRYGQGSATSEDGQPWQTADVYYIYLDDDSINDTGAPVLMGRPGTNYCYTVPEIGSMVKEGTIYREVTREECLLYPYRRLIIWTDGVCLNPDPQDQVSPYWHAKVPVVRLTADDWPWTYLGFPVSKNASTIELANTEIARGVVDNINVRLSPPTGYDRNVLSDSAAQTLNLRIPNQRVPVDYTYGGDKQLRPLLDASFLNFPTYVLEFMQQNEARIKDGMGVADATALARARQMPAGDSTERLLEAMGPLIKDMSRNMESAIVAAGGMWLINTFQFYSAKRRFQLVGVAGMADEDIDFDPGTLIPSGEGSRHDRAREHVQQFTYTVSPYSIHEINSTTRKLFMLQLQRSGFPISWWTLAKHFDIHDFGPLPQVPDPHNEGQTREAVTELEKWIAQQQIVMRMQAALAQASGGAGGKQQGKGGGRPPTGQQPPSLAQKADGRSTIRESSK